jgi:uncharacterized protein YjiS (DUF1127 family)
MSLISRELRVIGASVAESHGSHTVIIGKFHGSSSALFHGAASFLRPPPTKTAERRLLMDASTFRIRGLGEAAGAVPLAARLFRLVARLADWLIDRQEAWRQREQLRSLDDRMLRDLGLTRADILHIADGGRPR